MHGHSGGCGTGVKAPIPVYRIRRLRALTYGYGLRTFENVFTFRILYNVMLRVMKRTLRLRLDFKQLNRGNMSDNAATTGRLSRARYCTSH